MVPDTAPLPAADGEAPPPATAAPGAAPAGAMSGGAGQAGPLGPVGAALPPLDAAALVGTTGTAAPAAKPGEAPPPATAAAAPPRPAPPPMQQLAPVAIALALLPGERSSLRIALEPPELGRVEVRITRGADGGDAVRILVERPETLALLQRDQRELGRALEGAGMQAGGGISFGLSGQEGGGTAPRDGSGGEAPRGTGQPRLAASGQPATLPSDPRPRAAGLGLLDIAV